MQISQKKKKKIVTQQICTVVLRVTEDKIYTKTSLFI